MQTATKTVAAAIVILIASLLPGCRHKAGDYAASASTNTANAISGRWTIGYFNENGTDMSEHLAGYSFDFRSTGVLAVATGLDTVNGTWMLGSGTFQMTLPGADPMLAELGTTWEVTANTGQSLQLRNNHSGHQMDVHFSKQ